MAVRGNTARLASVRPVLPVARRIRRAVFSVTENSPVEADFNGIKNCRSIERHVGLAARFSRSVYQGGVAEGTGNAVQ